MGVEAAIVGGALLGGTVSAISAGNVAQEQSKEARRQQSAALKAAGPSPQEIAALEQATHIASSDLQRKERILASTDPAILELGKQTLAMLRGEKEVGSNKFMRQDLADQRAKLESRLRAQFGAGYETTTAGMQALNDFDRKSAQALQANQEQTLGSYLGIANQYSANGLSQDFANQGTLAQLQGNISSRKANAIMGTGSRIIDAAGAGHMPGVYMGQTIASAGTLAGLAQGGYFSKKPTGSGGGGGYAGADTFNVSDFA